ncbi:cyclin-dependent kinase inhibitor 1C-like [Sabethes cyaneus]|uniref:cyclin-dependent kinase inhibitor 1C-like n=1 Tax=Sabethes cyaneus TaxID=53552 RepID=UPI00237D8142|nr:cyclin-dependent kinase inhibitor 1C-like [Sabethes cyaneus]
MIKLMCLLVLVSAIASEPTFDLIQKKLDLISGLFKKPSVGVSVNALPPPPPPPAFYNAAPPAPIYAPPPQQDAVYLAPQPVQSQLPAQEIIYQAPSYPQEPLQDLSYQAPAPAPYPAPAPAPAPVALAPAPVPYAEAPPAAPQSQGFFIPRGIEILIVCLFALLAIVNAFPSDMPYPVGNRGDFGRAPMMRPVRSAPAPQAEQEDLAAADGAANKDDMEKSESFGFGYYHHYPRYYHYGYTPYYYYPRYYTSYWW